MVLIYLTGSFDVHRGRLMLLTGLKTDDLIFLVRVETEKKICSQITRICLCTITLDSIEPLRFIPQIILLLFLAGASTFSQWIRQIDASDKRTHMFAASGVEVVWIILLMMLSMATHTAPAN